MGPGPLGGQAVRDRGGAAEPLLRGGLRAAEPLLRGGRMLLTGTVRHAGMVVHVSVRLGDL